MNAVGTAAVGVLAVSSTVVATVVVSDALTMSCVVPALDPVVEGGVLVATRVFAKVVAAGVVAGVVEEAIVVVVVVVDVDVDVLVVLVADAVACRHLGDMKYASKPTVARTSSRCGAVYSLHNCISAPYTKAMQPNFRAFLQISPQVVADATRSRLSSNFVRVKRVFFIGPSKSFNMQLISYKVVAAAVVAVVVVAVERATVVAFDVVNDVADVDCVDLDGFGGVLVLPSSSSSSSPEPDNSSASSHRTPEYPSRHEQTKEAAV